MSEEQHIARLQAYLVNLVLILVGLALCAWIRFTFVLTDEIHQTRVDLSAQIAAVNTAIQTTGNRLDSRSQDITVALHTFGKRVDSNITDTRATIQNVGKSAQASAVQQIKETREVLNDTIGQVGQATQDLAAVAQEAAQPAKPIQVNIPAPVVTPAVVQPVPIQPQEQKPEKKKKRGFWKRILHPWR